MRRQWNWERYEASERRWAWFERVLWAFVFAALGVVVGVSW